MLESKQIFQEKIIDKQGFTGLSEKDFNTCKRIDIVYAYKKKYILFNLFLLGLLVTLLSFGFLVYGSDSLDMFYAGGYFSLGVFLLMLGGSYFFIDPEKQITKKYNRFLKEEQKLQAKHYKSLE